MRRHGRAPLGFANWMAKGALPRGGSVSRGGSFSRRGSGSLNQEPEETVLLSDANMDWHGLPSVERFTKEEIDKDPEDFAAQGGCGACRSRPCEWASCVEGDAIASRHVQLQAEIARLFPLRASGKVHTVVTMSSIRGGKARVCPRDALRELRWESIELDKHIHLAQVDREYHDAVASTFPAVEVVTIHTYPTLMWKADAVDALHTEREAILARVLATEIVDDLLEDMLDSWVFGQRVSEYPIAGHVPSFKKEGNVRPGDQRRSVVFLEHRYRLRLKAKALGQVLAEERRGTRQEKAEPIERESQARLVKERAQTKADEAKHLLDETETTMQFGVLSMVMQYLHAQQSVRRERNSWLGVNDALDGDAQMARLRMPKTQERRRMEEEQRRGRDRQALLQKAMERARRAEERTSKRNADERAQRARRRAWLAGQAKREMAAAVEIQRIFRGWRGVLQARVWALKRAQVEGLKAVLHEAATAIQRVYRGHLGREEAREVRMELAEWIARTRVKEAQADIKDYWDTHEWTRKQDQLLSTLRGLLPGTKRKATKLQ